MPDMILRDNGIRKEQKQPLKVFCKKSFIRNFRKFHKKTPMLESLFDKVAGLQTFIKKRLQHSCFPSRFTKFLGTVILKNICKHSAASKRKTYGYLQWGRDSLSLLCTLFLFYYHLNLFIKSKSHPVVIIFPLKLKKWFSFFITWACFNCILYFELTRWKNF